MYSLVTIVNNTVLYIWNLLKEQILKSSYHKKKNNCVVILKDAYYLEEKLWPT